MTSLETLKSSWTAIGNEDPLFGVLTQPDKRGRLWQLEEFMETGRNDVRSMLDFAARNHVSPRSERALDFGCGVGRLTQALCQVFREVHGVDISPAMLQCAREQNAFPDRCVYHELGTSARLPFPDAAFDFVGSLITLQHIAPEFSRAYLREFARVLRPGGVLIVQVPDRISDLGFRQTAKRGQTVGAGLAESGRRPRGRVQRWSRRLAIPVEDRLRALRNKRRTARAGAPRRHGGSPTGRGAATAAPVKSQSPMDTMEMHCLPEADVRSILTRAGLRIVDVITDDAAGEFFVSRRYLARNDTV